MLQPCLHGNNICDFLTAIASLDNMALQKLGVFLKKQYVLPDEEIV